MRFIIMFFLFLFACSKPQTVFICGDHVCINKAEANEYFKENLTLKVKVIKNGSDPNFFDLVDLNLNDEKNDKQKKIQVKRNDEKNLRVKKLSKKEIIKKKKELRLKKTKEKNKNKNIAKKRTHQFETKKRNSAVNNHIISNNICTKIENCNIDEIAEFLIRSNKNKKFPNLSN